MTAPKLVGHTPGPWVVRTTGLSSYVEAREGDISIAECHDDCSEANARLIAAAPEMLEALKDVLAWLSGPRYGNPSGMIRAAIAKATGGTA